MLEWTCSKACETFILFMMPWGLSLLVFVQLLEWISRVGKFSAIISNIFSALYSSVLYAVLATSVTKMLDISYRLTGSLGLFLFLSLLSLLFRVDNFNWSIFHFNDSFLCSILLLSPFCLFFNLVIVIKLLFGSFLYLLFSVLTFNICCKICDCLFKHYYNSYFKVCQIISILMSC